MRKYNDKLGNIGDKPVNIGEIYGKNLVLTWGKFRFIFNRGYELENVIYNGL